MQLLVYKVIDGNKIYQFDVEFHPSGPNKRIIKPGEFITTQKELDAARLAFPSMQGSDIVKETFYPSRNNNAGSSSRLNVSANNTMHN